MRGHLWRSLVQNPAAAGLTSKLDQISQSLTSTSSQTISSLMGETCLLCHSKKKMALAMALCGNHWGSWSIASDRKWVKEALTWPHSLFALGLTSSGVIVSMTSMGSCRRKHCSEQPKHPQFHRVQKGKTCTASSPHVVLFLFQTVYYRALRIPLYSSIIRCTLPLLCFPCRWQFTMEFWWSNSGA